MKNRMRLFVACLFFFAVLGFVPNFGNAWAASQGRAQVTGRKTGHKGYKKEETIGKVLQKSGVANTKLLNQQIANLR